MHNRREFLRWSIAAAGVVAASRILDAEPHSPRLVRDIGVQLYTVRDEAERDLPSVLAAIRKIGYSEVETYWNVYSHPAPELRRMIEDHGLKVPSGHFNYDGLEGKLDYAKTLGVEYVICPMLPETMWFTLEGYKRAADQFNIWGEKIHQAGMQFGRAHLMFAEEFAGRRGQLDRAGRRVVLVVILSPNIARIRASTTSTIGSGCFFMPSK